MPSSTAANQSNDKDNDHQLTDAADPSGESYDSYEDPEEEEEVDDDNDENGDVEEEEEEEDEGEEEEEDEEEEEAEEEEGEGEGEGEEEEEEGEEVGDDSSGSPIAADKNQNDVMKNVDYERHDKHLGSYSSMQEKAEVSPPRDSLAVGESSDDFKISGPSSEQLELPNGELCMHDKGSNNPRLKKHLINFEENGIQESAGGVKVAGSFLEKKSLKSHCERHYDIKSHPLKCEVPDAEITWPSGVTRSNVASAVENELYGASHSEEVEKIGLQSEDIKQRASRLAASQIGTGSLSPGAELANGTTQSAVLCNFFAKGWCIKGNSCRFLHMKDHVDNAGQQPDGKVVAEKCKEEIQAGEGLTDSREGSRLSGPCDPLAFSIKNVGRDSLKDSSQDNYVNQASQIVKSCSDIIGDRLSSRTYLSSGTPSYAVEDLDRKQSQSPINDHTSPVLSRYLSSGSNSSVPNIGMLPRMSARTRSSLSYSSSSLNADSLDFQKVINRGGEFHPSTPASLLRSSYSSSSYEPKIVLPSSAGHKRKFSSNDWEPSRPLRKFSSNDWEPSRPFRPSFFISLPSMSSPGSQYDPLRDSIEPPKVSSESFKVYSYSKDASTLSTSHHRIFDDPDLNETFHPEDSTDKLSISSRDKIQENVFDKICYAHEKKLSTNEAEATGSSRYDQKKRNIVPKEGNPLGPIHVKDVLETNKVKAGFDPRHQSGEAKHKKELKVGLDRQNGMMDVDRSTEGDVKESKALRHFRAALIESVKEFLKPAWHDGRVSKDAHNLIVKKAVEKVLSTVPSHQIPSTVESVRHYLSSSQPKIAKLVEGYVDKYGKS